MPIFAYPQLQERLFQQTLPNGLHVMVLPRPGFTRKIAYFVTDYGALHTDFTLNGEHIQAPAGIAHYLEHKMFDMPDGDVMAKFATLGANPNAFTSYDLTAYYFTCTDNFYESLELLLQYVSTPYFTEASVAKEQGIIGQEIGMHEDSPDARLFENLVSALYGRHPVRVPILGSRDSIAQITPALLEACHKAFYCPGNMLLCIVGDVDPGKVCQMAESILPREDTAQVSRVQTWPEEMAAVTPLVEDKMEVAMPMFYLGFKCEPLENGEAAVRAETIGDLAAEALFGESSPLYLRLYEEGLIDTSFGGGFDTLDGMAMLAASGDSENPQAVRDAILAEAKRLVQDGIPEGDFLRMKRGALGRRIRDLDSFDSTCFRLCAYYFSDFDYFRFPGVYQSVEVREVLEFLQRVVTGQRCALSIIYPPAEK